MTDYWQRVAQGFRGWVFKDPGPAEVSIDEIGPRIDPYLLWADATGFLYLGGADDKGDLRKLPVVLELQTSAKEFARKASRYRDLVAVPSFYASPPSGLDESRFCAATVSLGFFEELRQGGLFTGDVRRFQVGLPNIEHGEFEARFDVPDLKRGSGPVVTAVIDDGLAFAHARFRAGPKSTRVAYFWNQDGPVDNANVLGVGYGRELAKGDIDQLLDRATHVGTVDEDAVYRWSESAAYHTPGHKTLGRRIAHGTHVMDLACGCDLREASTDPIIAVQLPVRTTRDTSGRWLYPHVIDGLRYILNRADALAADAGTGPWPVVANLSYGLIAGPHDGTSLLESAIDELIDLRRANSAPLAVVLASGNSHLARCHARICLGPGEERQLDWRVLPDDMTDSHMEIWPPNPGPTGIRPELEIRVTTPWGDTSPPVRVGGAAVWKPKGRVLAGIFYVRHPASGDRPMILVSLAPTASLARKPAVAPFGIWRVSVKNVGSTVHDIEAWIQRDDTPIGFPVRGRQSRFEDPRYVRFDGAGREQEDDDPASYVKRSGSISAMATGGRTLVIGGFRRSDFAPARYSAGGPIVSRTMGPPVPRSGFDPDAMLPSEDSVACHGLLAAGTRSGSVFAMNGTSVAAPQAARLLAERFAAAIATARQAVKDFAAAQETDRAAEPSPARPPRPAPERGGAGRIDHPRRVSVERWRRWRRDPAADA